MKKLKPFGQKNTSIRKSYNLLEDYLKILSFCKKLITFAMCKYFFESVSKIDMQPDTGH